MKAFIVDDEFYAREGLRIELEEIGGVEIVGMFEDCSNMLEGLNNIHPDIIFLDIEMPQMNGFELLDKLAETGVFPNIVFVTAYSQYAVKAFEINAADYIVKPVIKSRLVKTLERISSVPVPQKEMPLKITCFRHFSILLNGKEVNTGWRTRKAEELIAFLISERGSFVSKEKIAEALWPEQDRESALANLYMAYYYIKKQEDKVGFKILIESERGKMRINTGRLDCDMLEFTRLLDAGNRAKGDERALCWEKAAELYLGPLFEDGYYPWVTELQSHYEYLYTELLENLIDYYTKKNSVQKAAHYGSKLRAI